MSVNFHVACEGRADRYKTVKSATQEADRIMQSKNDPTPYLLRQILAMLAE